MEATKRKTIERKIIYSFCLQEEAWKKKLAEEERLKAEREKKKLEMKKKIAEEIEKLKQLEEEKTAKLKLAQSFEPKQPSITPQHEQAPPVPEEPKISLKSKCMIEQMKLQKEKEEMRIKSEEARKAAERREHARKEAERLKKEAEMARKKAIEEEMKKMKEQEEIEREEKREAQRRKRIEEEREIAEKIRLRKLEEKEQQRLAQEEAEAQKIRDQEESKRIMLENMQRKLAADEAEKKRKLDEEKIKPKKKTLAENPILQRFEELNKQAEEKEKALEAARRSNTKKKVWKKKSREVLKLSRLRLAQALSKEKISTPEGKKNFIKAVSKEILKVLSRESLTRKSNASLKRSKDNLRMSRDLLLRSKSKGKIISSKENMMSQCNQMTAMLEQPSQQDMQNYLISHVLFDGTEDVQAEDKNAVTKQPEEEEDLEEKMFESYKEEMEKYLNFVCADSKDYKKKKTKKRSSVAAVEPEETTNDKKLLVNISSIKNQFETMASPEAQVPDPVVDQPTTKSKRVGKIDANAFFLDQVKEKEKEEQLMVQKKKKAYVPVIIDRDAFERTTGKFTNEKCTEEDRPKIKRDVKVWKHPDERKAEREQKKRDLAQQIQEEMEKIQALDLGFSNDEGKSTLQNGHTTAEENEANLVEEEEEEQPEPELTEEEKVAKMDIHTRIAYELDKVRIKEEEQKKKIARDNKKREIAIQIRDQIKKIKALASKPKEEDTIKRPPSPDDELPPWMRMRMQSKHQEEHVEEHIEELPKNSAEDNDEEDTPKWIKMIKERQEQLRQFEVQYKKQQKELEEARAMKSTTTTKSQVEENKEQGESSHFMEKKPKYLEIKTFSSVKEQFEAPQSGDSGISSPTSAPVVSPYEINPERVKMIKEQLMKSREKTQPISKPDKKEDGFLARKCSAIKSKLEQAFTTSNDEKKPTFKMPKKIVHISQEPSIDELLKAKKERNAEKKWSYKQKDMNDLHMLLQTNQKMSNDFKEKVKEVEEQSSQVLNKRKQLIDLQEEIESKEIEDYSKLMENVHSYLNSNAKKSPEEIAFRNTIEGYLTLIEESEQQQQFSKKNNKKATNKKVAKNNHHELPTKSIQAIKLSMEQEGLNQNGTSKSSNIGKLNMAQFEHPKEDERKLSVPMGQGYTSSIRDQLIKTNLSKDEAADQPRIAHKMKLRHVETPKSIEESLKELKAQRMYEWKWKHKKIEQLQDFIEKNQDVARIVVPTKSSTAFVDTTANDSENISYDSELVDYMKMMDNIKDFLQKDAESSTEKKVFKESLCSYLDLIEVDEDVDEGKERINFDWNTTNQVKSLSEKMEKQESDQEHKGDAGNKTIGKLDTKKFEDIKAEELKPETVIRTSNFYCDLIKSSLEKSVISENNEDLSPPISGRTMKIINVPEVESYEETLKQLKSRRQNEWKWKQKTIQELGKFLKTNEHASEITSNADVFVKRFDDNNDLVSLREKSEQLAKSIQERDKAMKSFMNDLQDFSDKPSENADEVVFKEGIKAFLDLIEVDKKQDNTTTLPNIDTPFKLGSKKDKYLEGLNIQDDTDLKKLSLNKKIGKVDTSGLLLNSKKTEAKKTSENAEISSDKASLIKKMFETTKMSRTRSELSVLPKVKRTKTLIDPMKSTILPQQIPMLQRRPSIKKQISIPSYYSEDRPKSDLKEKDTAGPPRITKSEWDDFSDPEERKRAILAKHGFKPHKVKPPKDDDPLKGIDTIPDHIMNDEVLYRKYIQENVVVDDDESSRDSSPERFKKDPKEGSFSSLMNILTAVKKATIQKNVKESRKMLDSKASANGGMTSSKSVQDLQELAQIPGSCQNLRQYFETNNAEDDSEDDEEGVGLQRNRGVLRSSSCATLGAMWTDHINSNTSETSAYDRSSIKSGLVSNLKHHLKSAREDNSTSNIPFNDPVMRKSLSHLELDDNQQYGGAQSDAKLELEALRSSGTTSSIFKLERGRAK